MAFEARDLKLLGSNLLGTNVFTYASTADTETTMAASGYFAADVINPDDIIFYKSSDSKRGMFYVTSTSPLVVTGDFLNASTVEVEDGSITPAKLADGAVTDAKITGMSGAKLTAGTVAEAALDTATQAKLLGTSNVVNSMMAANAINTANISDANVTEAKLDAPTQAKLLGTNNVATSNYAAQSVDTAALKDANVTKAKLAADSVDGTKIEDDSLNSEHYIAGSIDNEHLADNIVGGEEVATYATNDSDAGVPVIYHLSTAGGATANTDYVLNDAITICQALVHLQAAGTPGDTVQLQTSGGANNVSQSLNIGPGAQGQNYSTNIVPPHGVFAAGSTIRINQTDGGGSDSPALRVTLIGFKHA